MPTPVATGVAEHLGWALLVSVALTGEGPLLIDSRRVELVAAGVPCMPFHHDTDGLELDVADTVLAQVSASASACAEVALQAVADAVDLDFELQRLAIRMAPLADLPRSVQASRDSYHVNCRADGMLYHQAICAAARRRGMKIVFHKRGEEAASAALSLGTDRAGLQSLLQEMGNGQPSWTKEHRHAAAAAIAAL